MRAVGWAGSGDELPVNSKVALMPSHTFQLHTTPPHRITASLKAGLFRWHILSSGKLSLENSEN